MGRAKEKTDEKKLRSWKLLDDFRRRLAKVRAEMPPPPEKRHGGPQCMLPEADYFSLMLFGMLNPVLDSMRGLCAASHLERVQDEVCTRPVSLCSFSEAQGVFDPGCSKASSPVWQRKTRLRGATRGSPISPTSSSSWMAPCFPPCRACTGLADLGDQNRAAKLHLKFSVLRQGACDALITAGNPP